jgi:hypothetical protein
MTGPHRWLSMIGEEVIVLPIAEPYEYNVGKPDTTLVECLVLYSEHSGSKPGDCRKFAVSNLTSFASLQNRVR